ncbi:hypothetical protein ACFSKW_39160 [Nonomuraea mangrovi]|uniref:Transposase n=1 Tax=Nonomuraea mangrovi TaxID=2316207 RepID=A0ABW4T6B2_9ACTN
MISPGWLLWAPCQYTFPVDRIVHGRIAGERSRSTEGQAGRDGIVDRNPAKVRGWQQEFKRRG